MAFQPGDAVLDSVAQPGLRSLADDTGMTTVTVDPGDDEVAAAFAEVGTLDVVVNAAVQMFGYDAAVHELEAAVWDRTMRVNLRGTFLTCK